MSARPLIIIGAGGHGKVVADAALAAGRELVGFLDPALPAGTLVLGRPVLGGDSLMNDPDFVRDHGFCVAVGSQAMRRRLCEAVLAAGRLAAIIHPSAVVASSARIGAGTVVLAGAVINPDAQIGQFAIVNVCASVDHDCRLGDNVQVGPGARITGGVECGEDVLVGAGAVLVPGVRVGAGAIVGAGAVVIRDVPALVTVAGVPARPLLP